jgi:hypothetical protein
MIAEFMVPEPRKHFQQQHRAAFAPHIGIPIGTSVYLVAHCGEPPGSFGVSHFRWMVNPNRFGVTSCRAYVATFNVRNVGFQVLAYYRDDELPFDGALTMEITSAGNWCDSETALWPPTTPTAVTWAPTSMLAGPLFEDAYHNRWSRGPRPSQ